MGALLKLWSPSELCSSSQTSNNKTFIAPESIIYCAQNIYFVRYFPLKSLLLICLFSCRLVTPETMMSFVYTKFSCIQKNSINPMQRFETYIVIWETEAQTRGLHPWLDCAPQRKKHRADFRITVCLPAVININI